MKKILFNCALLLVLALLISVDTKAQRPRLDPNAGKINPAVKKAAEKQAAINKILNATVSKVEFEMSRIPSHIKKNEYMSGTVSLFGDRKINLKENNNGDFVLKENLTNKPVVTKLSGDLLNETHSFTPGTTTRYKDLLNNGFTVNIDFTKRSDPGFKFQCDFLLVFYFTDGTKVAVALQDMNGSSVGSNVFLKEVHVSKNMPGSVFPDPENPLVLPPIK